MKLTFKRNTIEIRIDSEEEDDKDIMYEEELIEESKGRNNKLFQLIEKCVVAEDIAFEVEEDASPFLKKLSELLEEEFAPYDEL